VQFEQPLLEGTLISRDKFKAQVKLRSGEEILVHCPNPSNLQGCATPGNKVLLSKFDDPRHRFKHQLEIVYVGKTAVGIPVSRPTTLFYEAMLQGKIPELAGYGQIKRDIGLNTKERIDFVLDGNGLRPCYVVVENIAVARDRAAYIPDAPQARKLVQLGELTNIVREGNRAMFVFVVTRSDAETLRIADEIDPEYGQALRDTLARGVESVCYRSTITKKGIELEKRLPIDLSIW